MYGYNIDRIGKLLYSTKNVNDEYHSYNDKHALLYANGTKVWFQHGMIHRDGTLPAVIHHDGSLEWYRHGKLHRDDDLPAVEYIDGRRFWYQCGLIHRDNDKYAIINNGIKTWFKYGQVHRDGGKPAVIYPNGTKEWFENDKLHRAPDIFGNILPARISGDTYTVLKDGKKRSYDTYYKHGKLFCYTNLTGKLHPSELSNDKRAFIYTERYRIHRIDGVAFNKYGIDKWWYNGIEVGVI